MYTFRSLRFCEIDFQRSIALNEIICLPGFVLTHGLYNFFGVAQGATRVLRQSAYYKIINSSAKGVQEGNTMDRSQAKRKRENTGAKNK